MPRPKVTEDCRRRVAKACLRCQKSKYKCDGQTPCAQCIKRNRSLACAYSSIERSYGQHRRRRKRADEYAHHNHSSAGASLEALASQMEVPLAEDVYQRPSPTAQSSDTAVSQRQLPNPSVGDAEPDPSQGTTHLRPRALYDTSGRIGMNFRVTWSLLNMHSPPGRLTVSVIFSVSGRLCRAGIFEEFAGTARGRTRHNN
jgi:hypothetical protein